MGKTVEQALLEVMEEEELANLRAQQRAFEELRNAEMVETQRLEEQERRHREEKVSDKTPRNLKWGIGSLNLTHVLTLWNSSHFDGHV